MWEYRPTVASHCGLPGIPSNCGLPLWPPTVASHCGLPLWEAMGIPLKIALNQFAYVFLREATGGHSWRPWEYHSKLLLINFPMFSYRRQWEATWEYRSKSLLINFPMFSYRRQREATGIPLERRSLI